LTVRGKHIEKAVRYLIIFLYWITYGTYWFEALKV